MNYSGKLVDSEGNVFYPEQRKGNIFKGQDFNNFNKVGTYVYGGVEVLNKPPNWGMVEVIVAGTFVLQRVTNTTKVCVRSSWDGGASWEQWKTLTLS